MNISLTSEQLKNLLLLVYLGDWVANSHLERPDHHLSELADHIFSLAGRSGMADEMEYSPEDDKWYPTRDYEDQALEHIEGYNDEVFWDELVDRMAFRDFNRTYGEEAAARMSVEERIEKSDPFIEKYEIEFEKNGIDRLVIREAPPPPSG